MRKDNEPDAGSFLPLPQAMFHILVALADRDQHGYAIMQDVAARTNGKLKLSPGTLYGSIKKMLEDGLIQEIEPRLGAVSEDERRRTYRLTRFGRQVAAAEAERLSAMLSQARASGLVPKRT
ncbi:MAG TPA: PadR family transcriptional regulator [Bryobacteraceae bacterium]|nr:PadR family transcriptional regulator [Bryobacteraceae bacterium]